MAEKTEAQKWVDRLNSSTGLAGGWRLETLSKRYSPVEGKEIPVRIRRFARGIPCGIAREALEYLLSLAPYSGALFNGESTDTEYRPTMSMWVRDDQQRVDGNAAGTYTLVQDLVEDGVDETDGADSEVSCSEEETTKWVWDAPFIEDLLVTGGTQGKTYAIRNVQRKDSGLFDYSVVTRTAKTQHSGPTVASCTETETVYVETWDNVYGSDGDYRFDSATGTAISVPNPTARTQGTLYEVDVSENRDCTFRITVRRRVSSLATYVRTLCYADLYSTRSQTSHSRSGSSLPTSPKTPSGGVKTTYESEMNPDGTYDNRTTVERETGVKNASVEYRKTLRGVVTVVSDRNQQSTVTPSGMKIGETRSAKKTEGGLFDTVVQTTDASSVGTIGTSCETTVFQHRHSETSNEADQPGEEASSAGGGMTYQVTSRATDEGTWDVERTVTTERSVPNAQVGVRKTLRGVVTTSVHRGSSDGSTTVTRVGDEVQVERTPGGLFTRTVKTVAAESVGVVGSSCETTVFRHVHETTTNVVSKPEDEAEEAGGGKTRRLVLRATDEGTWDCVETDSEELTVPLFRTSCRVSARTVTTTVESKSLGSAPVSDGSVGSFVQSELTPGGMYDVTESRSVARAGDTALAVRETPMSVATSTTQTSSERGSASGSYSPVNTERTVSSRLSDDGVWDVQTESTVFRPVHSYRTSSLAVSSSDSARLVEQHGVYNSETSVTGLLSSEGVVYTGVSARLNDHGSIDASWTKIVASDMKSWDAEVALETLYSYTVWFKNATEPQYKSCIQSLVSKCNSLVEEWISQDRGPASYAVSPEVHRNEFGLYDGSVTFRATWANDSAGRTGAVNATTLSAWAKSYDALGDETATYITKGRGRQQLNNVLNSVAAQFPSPCKSHSFDVTYAPESSTWLVTTRYTAQKM